MTLNRTGGQQGSKPTPPEHSKFKPGQSGNPNGRPKGTKSWSTIVQNILEDEDLFQAMLDNSKKPGWVDKLKGKNAANAIAVAMSIRALGGDNRAAEWLRKTGWGDKVVHDFEESLFSEGKMQITVVKSEKIDDQPDTE